MDYGSTFRFVITSPSRNKHGVEQGADWLTQGLELLGIGAKTAVGYGIMAAATPGGAGSPTPNRETVWYGVPLAYKKGSGEIRGDHEGNRAFSGGSEAKALVDGLSAATRGKLERGRLKAILTVEPLGDKNWRILKIDLG